MIKIKEIREAKAFNDYRNFVIGKYNKTYFNTEDLILNVTLTDCINYLVKDIKTGQTRTHSTRILKSEVYNK